MQLIEIRQNKKSISHIKLKADKIHPIRWIFAKNRKHKIEIETKIQHDWSSNASDNGEITNTSIGFFFKGHRLLFEYEFETDCEQDPKSHRSCRWTWDPDYLKLKTFEKQEKPIKFNEESKKLWGSSWKSMEKQTRRHQKREAVNPFRELPNALNKHSKSWKGRWSRASFRQLKKSISQEYIDCLGIIVKRLQFPLHPDDPERVLLRKHHLPKRNTTNMPKM